MAITQAVCASFKKQLLDGVHDLDTGGNVFKLALYNSSATINAATTSYTTGNEVAASGQYAAKGGVLAGQLTSLVATTAFVDFTDRSWTGCNNHGKRCITIQFNSGTKSCLCFRFWGR